MLVPLQEFFLIQRDVCSWSINNNAYLFNFIYKKNNER